MSAGIFARVIAPQEFALGLSQLGTDGSRTSISLIDYHGARLASLSSDRRRSNQLDICLLNVKNSGIN